LNDTFGPSQSHRNFPKSLLIFMDDEKTSSTVSFAGFRITDASDNAISGAQDAAIQIGGPSSSWTLDQQVTMIAYATPATENAVTYKLRFRRDDISAKRNKHRANVRIGDCCMITTAQAVMSLRPGAEWTMSGDDVENIIWHTESVEPLTAKEVQAEVKRLEKAAADEAAAKEAAKASGLAKLEALGLTHDEAVAIAGI
jgi:hypothetical protein